MQAKILQKMERLYFIIKMIYLSNNALEKKKFIRYQIIYLISRCCWESLFFITASSLKAWVLSFCNVFHFFIRHIYFLLMSKWKFYFSERLKKWSHSRFYFLVFLSTDRFLYQFNSLHVISIFCIFVHSFFRIFSFTLLVFWSYF